MSGELIEAETFFNRANHIFANWEEHPEVWNEAQRLCIVSGKSSSDDVFMTNAIHIWLFGYVLSGTAMIFMKHKKRKIYILTFKKAHELLKAIDKAENVYGIEVELILRNRADKDKANFEKFVDILSDSAAGSATLVGTLLSDENKPVGEFGSVFYKEYLTASSRRSSFKIVGIDDSFSKLFAIKSSAALTNVEDGSVILTNIFKSVVDKMVKIVEEDKSIKHSAFSEKIETYFAKKKRCKVASNDDLDSLDIIYPPVVQSGENTVLKPYVNANDDELEFSAILFSIGARWNNYCSNMARTFLIDPTETMKANYSLLFNLQVFLMSKFIKHGVLLKDIYKAAQEFISNAAKGSDKLDANSLMKTFILNCGYGMGIEFIEKSLLINSKNETKVEPGMVFCINLGFEGLEDPDTKKQYSLWLADTVIITQEPESCVKKTTVFNSRLANITYSLEEEGAKEEEGEEEGKSSEGAGEKTNTLRRVRERDRKGEIERIRRQEDIFKKAQEDAKSMYENTELPSTQKGKDQDHLPDATKLEAYSSTAAFPKDAASSSLFVDVNKDSILCPINNVHVPIHISTIKNVSKGEEGDFHYLRINLISGTETGLQATLRNLDTRKTYVKEMTFRALDGRNINLVFKQIRDLKKKYNQRQKEIMIRKSIVKQDELIPSTTGRVVLGEVTIRPSPTSRKSVGELQAHTNGLRFVTRSGQKVDILYNNVKHFIFQPAETEYMTIIHLNLHNSILVSKKQVKDIQFYREIGEVAHALDKQEGPIFERDGIEEEQQEIEAKNEANQDFEKFCERVCQITTKNPKVSTLEYDIPFSKLGFYGVPFSSVVFLMPTADCLISVTETPFFVLAMDTVQLVYFERVDYSLKNFDLVFVPKDIVGNNVVQLNAVPKEHLDPIKQWLDKISISYFEGMANLNWNAIMNHARSDPKLFFEEGGWDFLKETEVEGGSDGDEESEVESEYKISSGEEYSESEEYDSGSAVSTSSSGEEEADEDEEGLDWEELERRAKEEDMKMNFSD